MSTDADPAEIATLLARIEELEAQIPPHPACLDGDLTDAQRVTRLLGKVKRLTTERDTFRRERNELRDKLFDKTVVDVNARLAAASQKGMHR
ncbi:hypothetical protein ACFWPK_34360 [Nocardia sp. NPDC058519]|uniref:hypothetical protein n=1 Tax=Nocardia sp. NPDC058519 TaxID=3346535 RepID=UPI0036605540